MQVEKRWIIKSTETGKFIGIDSHSGGYPYATDFWSCEKFRSFEKANSYADMGFSTVGAENGFWEIYETDEIGMRFVPQVDLYEIELAALKKKHGKI